MTRSAAPSPYRTLALFAALLLGAASAAHAQKVGTRRTGRSAASRRAAATAPPAAAPLAAPAPYAPKRVTAGTYAKAELFLPWYTKLYITGAAEPPHWLPAGDRFWYRVNTGEGYGFMLVDPPARVKRPVFDNAKLAAAMSLANDTSYDPTRLPFRTFKFAKDNTDLRHVEIKADKKLFHCDIVAYTCTAGDTLKKSIAYVESPDKKWEAFIHDHNVYVRPTGQENDSTQLTTDGVQYWSYGLAYPRPSQVMRGGPRRPEIVWSPDSRRLAVMRRDQRHVGLLPYISSTPQRPKLYTQPYALPGDSIVPKPEVYVLDVASKKSVRVQLPLRPNQLYLRGSTIDSLWTRDSERLHFVFLTRASKSAYLMEADAATGRSRILVDDTSRTYVDVGTTRARPSWYVSRDGNDIFWISERDGWAHIYRFGHDGKLKNQVTHGAWAVAAIKYVDEAKKQIYFTAWDREPDVPYYAELFRVDYDGSGLTRLTRIDANHDIDFSPDGRYFVDHYSWADRPGVLDLRRVADGRVLLGLEKTDVSRLDSLGWTPRKVFTVKARDGVTNVYGVMYTPTNLDPTKKYPIIDHIYPGPQIGSVRTWGFDAGAEARALAQLGFVVIELDAMGTPERSKKFHDTYYGFFGDNGLPDHVRAIKELAARYPFIDLSRVGIYGHSGGGFASTDAILRYPDFFKVAVSGSGNHDNRTYNIYWAEKYMGLLKKNPDGTDNFTSSANKTMASHLKGHLLLFHGDMDDNVDDANTIQLIDALIKANKDFDFVIAPNRHHPLEEPYFIRRRWDYFVRYLLGATPPKEFLITKPAPIPGE